MSAPTAALASDRRGAVMVAGIFQACFMVGLLYYLAGIGESIALRERIQDAADSGAFAAAAVQARGLNSVALLNVVLSAALALLAAIQAIIDLATLGLAIAHACSAFFGACSPAIPPLEATRDTAESVQRSIEGYVRQVTATTDKVSKIVAIAVPGIASSKVMDVSLSTYGPTAGVSFTWPAFTQLPIKLPSLRRLCDDAATDAIDQVLKPFQALPLPDRVLDPILDAAESYAKTAAYQYCYRLPAIPLPSLRIPTFDRTIYAPGPTRTGVSLQSAARYVAALLSSDEGQLEIADDAEMGDDHFQVRLLVVGNRDHVEVNDRGVQIALWTGDPDDGRLYRELSELGSVHFSGAEYYFDGDRDREEWMVHMKWGSRLRRFRPPVQAVDETVGQACQEWGGGSMCERADRVIELLGDLAIH